ncbi:MAG TPA: tyrosine-protein phosphatase [Candidatus Binatia bacterium]
MHLPGSKQAVTGNWQRSVRFDGCLNFRDLGGYPTRSGRLVRTGQVFRSDALHLLTANDIARLRHELRIDCVIDLRSTAELRTGGRGLLEPEPIHFHHLPLFDGEATGGKDLREDRDLADIYFLIAEFAMQRIGGVITAVAEAAGPTVYHCAAGKDRTGVISALILGILEVEDEIIVADYALTQENLDGIIQRLMATEGYRTMFESLPPDTMHARPQTMIGFLEKLRAKYGSMHGYARAAGIPDDTIQQLKERLL